MVKIIGERIELPNKVIVERPDRPYAFPKQVSALVTKTQIKPEDYALIQEVDEANSAISMIQRFNGKNHLDTNVEVLSSGLIVPRTSKLVTQLMNVNKALNRKGVLYDASGKLIECKRLEDYAHVLNYNCWVWLNESFKSGQGFLDLDVVYITGLENGNPVFQREPLQTCLEQDCYADLESVNTQGFPTKSSPVQKYEPGKSVYFAQPIEGMAVRFWAGSDGALFDCGGDPQGSDAGLGVFASCAEGASAEKLGDKK